MSNKVTYGSIEELVYLEAREQRHSVSRPSETGATPQRNGLSGWLIQRIRETDPDGKKALALTAKYRNKKDK